MPPSDSSLRNRFENALDWSFESANNSLSRIHVGPVLSGEKLIDDPDFKRKLLDDFPQAIGGEMEGTGLCAASNRLRKPWCLAKGICDWADGNKGDLFQPSAAAAAASLAHHVLSEPSFLEAVGEKEPAQ